MGISKTFYRGYQELNQLDFFSVDGVDLDSMNLADRINLHFKIGAFLGIKFTPEEQEVVDVVSKAETFDDALAAAEVMYTFCKAEQRRKRKMKRRIRNLVRFLRKGSLLLLKIVGSLILLAMILILIPPLTLVALLMLKVMMVTLILVGGFLLMALL